MPLYFFRTLNRILLLAFLYSPFLTAAAVLKNAGTSAATGKNIADTVIKNCIKSEQVEKIITEAISIGAPVYNSGYHLACYRIYEWAGYKILYEYGKECKEVEGILKKAIEKSHGDYSDLEKAWIMRQAFDKIMGVPTQMGEPEKKTDTQRKG